ncbi:putative reverse transcriptase domain-containing protein [Tanacetum coccineum]
MDVDAQFTDDGGGMNPEGLWKCMTLGYLTKKSHSFYKQEDMMCRNVIADTDELAPVFEIFVEANDRNHFEIVYLSVVSKKEEEFVKMYVKPKAAAVFLLGQIATSGDDEWIEERFTAVSILLKCIQEDGKCGNVIADTAELAPVLVIFVEANDRDRFEIVQFLSELTEPRKMSIYREEAIHTLISCLKCSDSPATQIAAADTSLALQRRFSSSKKPVDNIKGEVTSSKPADLNEAVRMTYKLMEQKSQARNERILEGKKRKWENLQGGNSSGKGNQNDNSRQTLQNNQKQGNARAMVTAPTDGKLPLCERCFTHHVGQCTIKCHKYGKKVKQEEVREVRGRAYAIKDAKPKGPNVVTGTFLLNNQYASVLFDSGSDRSFVNTRFSSLLDIKPIKIEDSYEVELADGRVVSTNTILKGCTLSLVNHTFKIDLMPIELGTFNVIIGMDWLVKQNVVIIYGEKVFRIPYGDKMLIVEGDKGRSRLKIISCIKARKYVEQGCHLFLAHITKEK